VRRAVNIEETEGIVESEIRRVRLPGYDRDDLRQEARIAVEAALRRVRKHDPKAPAYVRITVRNALRNLVRAQCTAGRAPHDDRGRRIAGAFQPDIHDLLPSHAPSPESTAHARQLVQALARERPADMEILHAVFVEGASAAHALHISAGLPAYRRLEAARRRAALILNRLLDNQPISHRGSTMTKLDTAKFPLPPTDDPDCHAQEANSEPIGYDAKLALCRYLCPDKHTCLALAIERGLVKLSLDDDHEVADVLSGALSVNDMKDRVRQRQKILGIPDGSPEMDKQIEGRVKLLPASLLVRKAEAKKAAPEKKDSTTAAPAAAPAAQEGPVKTETKNEAPKEPAAKAKPAKATKPAPAPKEAPKAAEPAPAAAAPKEPAKAPEKAAKAAPAPKEPAKAPEKPAKPAKAAKATPKEPAKAPEKPAKPVKAAKAAPAPKKAAKAPEKPAKGKAEAKPTKPAKPAKKAKGKKATTNGSKAKLPASYDLTPNPNGKGSEFGGKGWPTVIAGGKLKPLPRPRALSPEQMKEALARAKIGAPFDLTVGMKVIRHRRSGEDVIVELRKDGFHMDGETYPSLTACAMWAERRMRSGNDYFSVEAHDCVEIKGKGVPEGSYTRKSAE